jgi:heme-degrading monooxygenase HmoA
MPNLALARLLRPELIQVDGFIDNIRYTSKRRPDVLLSLSIWRDEKALIRWRTHALHHEIQGKGRNEIFKDYHLRVGEVAADNHLPSGQALHAQRWDETASEAKLISLIEAKRPAGLDETASAAELAACLGLVAEPEDLVDWDVFEAILSPSDLLLLLSWRGAAVSGTGTVAISPPTAAHLRQVRIVRDYGMADRREAPQYYPPVSILTS